MRESLLAVLDRKTHPSWERFQRGAVSAAGALVHYQQEFLIYLRDFPQMCAAVLAKGPPADAKRLLAETIYEEQTGGLSASKCHAELFLDAMTAWGHDRSVFESAALMPASSQLRAVIDEAIAHRDWRVGWAVLGLFLEGTHRDRQVLERPWSEWKPDVEQIVRRHPLVRHYGVAAEAMDMVRVHVGFWARRRHEAWSTLVKHLPNNDEPAMVAWLDRTLATWTEYRACIGARWEQP